MFFRDDEIFENLVDWHQSFVSETIPQLQAKGVDASSALSVVLDEFALELDRAVSRRQSIAHLATIALVGVDPSLAERTKALYRRVVAAPLSGKSFLERSLLGYIAASRDLDAPAFWGEVLALARVRGSIAQTRRRFATAALAYRALLHADGGSLARLVEASRDAAEAVREDAIEALGRVADALSDPELAAVVPGAPGARDMVLAELRRAATSDDAFGLRFFGRRGLLAAGEALTLDRPDGAFTFRFRGQTRVFERTLASTDTLFDLHGDVIAALGLDDEHLFEFRMKAGSRDRRFVLPTGDAGAFGGASIGALDASFGRDAGSDIQTEASDGDGYRLGELGLVPNHKFVLLHDFGDNHEIALQVVGVHDLDPRAKKTKKGPAKKSAQAKKSVAKKK